MELLVKTDGCPNSYIVSWLPNILLRRNAGYYEHHFENVMHSESAARCESLLKRVLVYSSSHAPSVSIFLICDFTFDVTKLSYVEPSPCFIQCPML
ncbi:hypothetical protein D3C85_1701270 [compost metagenome]